MATARELGLAVHLDGARLLNASVASGIPAAEYGRLADTVTLCCSKGLGCPLGAVLASSAERIEEAWRGKFLFGGAMRQAGIVAAAALYALDHHVDRLAEDHARARRLAERARRGRAARRPRAGRDELRRARRRRRSASTADEARARHRGAGRARRQPPARSAADRHVPRRHRRRCRPRGRGRSRARSELLPESERLDARLSAAPAARAGRLAHAIGRSGGLPRRRACSGTTRSGSLSADPEEGATAEHQYRDRLDHEDVHGGARPAAAGRGRARARRRRSRDLLPEAPVGPTVRHALAHLSGFQREPPGDVWETLAPARARGADRRTGGRRARAAAGAPVALLEPRLRPARRGRRAPPRRGRTPTSCVSESSSRWA